MGCTTILVGKNASYDGSTIIARNEDGGTGYYSPKKLVVVNTSQQPLKYISVISKVEIELPDNPMRYTAMPNATGEEGIWGANGVNECNVAMTATETITTNPLVMGADPLVKEGIGEEDLVSITLPYIHSAREGVQRLGMLHEKYGTYENNGIAFRDVSEIWWFETIGGHHWMAKKVPDDSYVMMPNQLGIDSFDFKDAYSRQSYCMCSEDLADFVEENHLDMQGYEINIREVTDFDARRAFGSHSNHDHLYNTPRAWAIGRYFNPTTIAWDGSLADYSPESDNIPWCLVPEHKITIEDVKYALSIHFEGTPYDMYLNKGDLSQKGKYRPIGINRNNFVGVIQLRPYVPGEYMAIQWTGLGSNTFNALVPYYRNVTDTPAYIRDTGSKVTTESFYWANRLIARITDSHYHTLVSFIERYQKNIGGEAHRFIAQTDKLAGEKENITAFLEEQNQKMTDYAKEQTDELLGKVLLKATDLMHNGFQRND